MKKLAFELLTSSWRRVEPNRSYWWSDNCDPMPNRVRKG